MASTARRARRQLDVWPGYVDALAALLILVIFVLLLFSFAQFLLSQLLDAQETELDVMYQRVVELTDLLIKGLIRRDDLPSNDYWLDSSRQALTARYGKFELAAGHRAEAERLLQALAAFANAGGLIPEQV